MSKGKSKEGGERRTLVSAFETADSYIFAAMATAREGVQESTGNGESVKHLLVIEDLLEQYRATIHAAIDGKAA